MALEKLFNIALQNRKILRSILTRLPKEMLTKIPDGYRNNIWWNMVHTVVTQQLLIYGLSGLPALIDKEWIERYRKGTAPEIDPTQEDIDKLLGWLISSVEQAEKDYQNGIFTEFNEYTTSNKVTLKTIEDAISFNAFHEGLHLGVILSQLKSLGIPIS